jgi:hypothetical protein
LQDLAHTAESSGVSETNLAGPSHAPESSAQHSSDVPLLSRLLAPADMKVSNITLQCLLNLHYPPSKGYRKKPIEKDLSEVLRPLKLFTIAVLKCIKNVRVSSGHAENMTMFMKLLQSRLPSVSATEPGPLFSFFRTWGIEVYSQNSLFEEGGQEHEAQVALALQASVVTAETEAGARAAHVSGGIRTADQDDDAAAEREKDILAELAEYHNALCNRFARWANENALLDALFPTSFTTEERKALKDFVRGHMALSSPESRL